MISFREVGEEDAEIILRWRTSERVSKWMVTDVENDLQKQKQWLASCYNNPSYYHWMILVNDKPAGIINVSNYSEVQKITSWGFYLGEIDFLGFGAFIPGYIYSFIFNRLLVNRIDVEIFDDNREVIDLHLFYGYQYAAKKCKVINIYFNSLYFPFKLGQTKNLTLTAIIYYWHTTVY